VPLALGPPLERVAGWRCVYRVAALIGCASMKSARSSVDASSATLRHEPGLERRGCFTRSRKTAEQIGCGLRGSTQRLVE
jgi:hypothetical protein